MFLKEALFLYTTEQKYYFGHYGGHPRVPLLVAGQELLGLDSVNLILVETME